MTVREEDEIIKGLSGKLGSRMGGRSYSPVWKAEGRVRRGLTCHSGSLVEPGGLSSSRYNVLNQVSHGVLGTAGTHDLSVHTKLGHPGDHEGCCLTVVFPCSHAVSLWLILTKNPTGRRFWEPEVL